MGSIEVHAELLKGQAEVWQFVFAFTDSMALKSAVQLRLADIVEGEDWAWMEEHSWERRLSSLQNHQNPSFTVHYRVLSRVTCDKCVERSNNGLSFSKRKVGGTFLLKLHGEKCDGFLEANRFFQNCWFWLPFFKDFWEQ